MTNIIDPPDHSASGGSIFNSGFAGLGSSAGWRSKEYRKLNNIGVGLAAFQASGGAETLIRRGKPSNLTACGQQNPLRD